MISGLMTGCSSVLNTASESSFSCPGMPQGITCKTPLAVYKSTNGSLPESEFDKPIQRQATPSEKGESPLRGGIPALPTAPIANNEKVVMPVRSEAKVMRIWIAPYTDKNDDLHLPSFLYTEVESRKWNLGEVEFSGNGVAVPHRVLQLAPGQSQSVTPNKFVSNQDDRQGAVVPTKSNFPSSTTQGSVTSTGSAEDLNLND